MWSQAGASGRYMIECRSGKSLLVALPGIRFQELRTSRVLLLGVRGVAQANWFGEDERGSAFGKKGPVCRTAGSILPPQTSASGADDVEPLMREKVLGQQVGEHLAVRCVGQVREVLGHPRITVPVAHRRDVFGGSVGPGFQRLLLVRRTDYGERFGSGGRVGRNEFPTMTHEPHPSSVSFGDAVLHQISGRRLPGRGM